MIHYLPLIAYALRKVSINTIINGLVRNPEVHRHHITHTQRSTLLACWPSFEVQSVIVGRQEGHIIRGFPNLNTANTGKNYINRFLPSSLSRDIRYTAL
jgi:hypothetical protein